MFKSKRVKELEDRITALENFFNISYSKDYDGYGEYVAHRDFGFVSQLKDLLKIKNK